MRPAPLGSLGTFQRPRRGSEAPHGLPSDHSAFALAGPVTTCRTVFVAQVYSSMNQTVQLLKYPNAAAPASASVSASWAIQVREKVHQLGGRIIAALNGWAVARADAALYEALSKMSDA